MSSSADNPYERAKGGRLTFKGGSLAATSKSIDKKKKKKKKQNENGVVLEEQTENKIETAAGEDIYAIDAAKKLKYEELFPVEAKKFGYYQKEEDKKEKIEFKTVEDALDDRVKRKADRYCK